MVDSTSLIEQIRVILEANLPDPWEAATTQTRTNYIYTNDIRLSGDFPKVLILADDTVPTKLSWAGRTSYIEKFVVNVNIMYYNKRAFKYTVGATTYQDGSNTS